MVLFALMGFGDVLIGGVVVPYTYAYLVPWKETAAAAAAMHTQRRRGGGAPADGRLTRAQVYS